MENRKAKELNEDIGSLYTVIDTLEWSPFMEIDYLKEQEEKIAKKFAVLYEKLFVSFGVLTDEERSFFRHQLKLLEKYFFWKIQSQSKKRISSWEIY